MSKTKLLILPFRQKRTHQEFLIKTKLIEKWDKHHPDHCSIIIDLPEDTTTEDAIQEELEFILNTDIPIKKLINLGLCSESQDSDTIYYLYCINVKNLDINLSNGTYEFVSKEEIIKNIDSQLIVAYTRLKFLNIS